MMPQKYSQTAEDFNFRIEKFPSATLSKFLPHGAQKVNLGSRAGFAYEYCTQEFTFCAPISSMVEISEVLPMEISRFES